MILFFYVFKKRTFHSNPAQLRMCYHGNHPLPVYPSEESIKHTALNDPALAHGLQPSPNTPRSPSKPRPA